MTAFRELRKLRGPHRRLPTDCLFRFEPVYYTARTQQPDRPRPFRMPSPAFHFYGHARTVLRPTYVSLSRRSDTRRKRAGLRVRIFFPSPRTFYKRRCARDGSGGTCRRGCKKTGGVRRPRVNRRPSYSGRAIAQPALILWVMHFAIVRLFYFVICYSSVLPRSRRYTVEVEYTRHRSAQSGMLLDPVGFDFIIILIHFSTRPFVTATRA